MLRATLLALVLACTWPQVCHGQTLGDTLILGGRADAFSNWVSELEWLRAPRAEGRRPVPIGVSGRSLELLQDAIARKWHRASNGASLPEARNILARSTTDMLPKLRGVMAEAIYLDSQPEWGYVSKPNASQHDVYRPRPGGGQGIMTGQVKYHASGKPSTYAQDMVKDWRSGGFYVPDDHVQPLKAYLRSDADSWAAAGNQEMAKKRYKDLNRVKPIGATAAEIDAATRRAVTEARVMRTSSYVMLGVSAAMVLVPVALDLVQGDITFNRAASIGLRLGSPLVAGIVADCALRYWYGGLFRGALRGNAIVGGSILLAETLYEVHEYGMISNALHSPEFLINLGSGIGGLALGSVGLYYGGIVGAGAGTAIAPGPGTAVGTFVGGALGGTAGWAVGSFGGKQLVILSLKRFAPKLLYAHEHQQSIEVTRRIASRIRVLQTI